MNHDMEARLHDGPLVWIVTSRSRPEVEHQVDLEAFGGIGTCSCEHFQFRIAPDLREGRREGARRCGHILVARAAFTDAMIQTIIRSRQHPDSDASDPVRPCPSCGEPIGNGASEHRCAICEGPCCTACSYDGPKPNQVTCEGCHYENE